MVSRLALGEAGLLGLGDECLADEGLGRRKLGWG